MKKTIKRKLFETPKGQLFFYKLRVLREKLALATLSDYNYVTKQYKKNMGREINLQNPSTFTEKLNWMKLFYRHEDMPIASDKYEVRDYIKSKGLEHILNDLIGVYTDANDIDYDTLPDKFVAKATHGSSWNLVCNNKESLDWANWVKIMNSWLKLNLFVFGREWNYKELTPRIVVEKFLEQDPLIDYKFFCFNGKPKYIQTNNFFEGKKYIEFYDLDWKKTEFTYITDYQSSTVLERPSQLKKMIDLATFLSKDFSFVRVDFYNVEEKIIFGEMTFFPSGGMENFKPVEKNIDLLLGKLLHLPEPNHNLSLLKKISEQKK